MKKNDINIIVDQNTSDTTKEKRDTGYLFQLLMKQRKTRNSSLSRKQQNFSESAGLRSVN